jgi:anti-sigma28 factor (negative regulator of flagellin synthesis)
VIVHRSPLPIPPTASDRAERAAGIAAIAAIARRIAGGRYRVSSERVAEAVLVFHRREV